MTDITINSFVSNDSQDFGSPNFANVIRCTVSGQTGILSNNDLSSIHLTTFHNLAGRDISGSIFNGKNDDFEVHCTFEPLTYVSEIFKKNIDTVIKEQISNNHFIYKCYEKNKEILNYSLDWNNVQIQVNFVNNEKNLSNKIFQSENLFDKATKEGKFNN